MRFIYNNLLRLTALLILFMSLTLYLLMSLSINHVIAGQPVDMTGHVYCDYNRNGIFDDKDKGLKNIHVQIFSGQCGGTALQATATDGEGNFAFRNFRPDTYFIQADLAYDCGGRLPTTSTCRKIELENGNSDSFVSFGYSEYGQ